MMDIPRRLSVHDDDYDPAAGATLVISLDGIDQHGRVTAYDIDAGTVTRCKHDAQGRVCVEGDQIGMETVHGLVTVERKAARPRRG